MKKNLLFYFLMLAFGFTTCTSKEEKANLIVDEAYRAFEEQNYDKAIELYDEAMKIKPNESYRLLLGDIYFETGEFPKAEQEYELLVDNVPEHYQAWEALGEARIYQQKFQEALPAFEKAISLKPDESFSSYYYASIVHVLNDNDKKAEEYIKKLVNINPSYRDFVAQDTVLVKFLD
jgi:tetratricopeptide (TPR) repeat protein